MSLPWMLVLLPLRLEVNCDALDTYLVKRHKTSAEAFTILILLV